MRKTILSYEPEAIEVTVLNSKSQQSQGDDITIGAPPSVSVSSHKTPFGGDQFRSSAKILESTTNLKKEINEFVIQAYTFPPQSVRGPNIASMAWFTDGRETYGVALRSLVGRYMNMGQYDHIVAILENVVLLVYGLSTATSTTQRMVALANFAKGAHSDFPFDLAAAILLRDLYKGLFKEEEKTLATQSGSFLQNARVTLDNYEKLKASPLYEKLYKFGMYALSLSLFSKMGVTMDALKLTEVAQGAIKAKYHMGPDFIHCCLDTLLFISERGLQCVHTGKLDCLFHSSSTYEEWFDRATEVARKSQFLSNPDAVGVDRYSILADLKEYIEQGKSIKRAAIKPAEKLLIGRLLAQLEFIHDMEVTRRSAQKARKSPFSVLIYGGTSIGKTSLTNILFYHYGKVMGLNTGSEFKYTRNPTEEFWSNFNSTQWCVEMDDIAFMAPSLGTMDPSLAEMLCVVNNVPFVPSQAELQDKGKTPVNARLVIGTTNTEDLNLHAYFSCPLAVQRRFPYVLDAEPKECYSKGGMLDTKSLPPLESGKYPDYWKITVKQVVPSTGRGKNQRGTLKTIGVHEDIVEFLKWYTTVIKEHELNQGKVMECNEAMSKIVLCDECSLPKGMCSCLTVQSGFADLIEPVVPSYISTPMTLLHRPVEKSSWFSILVYWFYLSLIYFGLKFVWFGWLLNKYYGEDFIFIILSKSREHIHLTRAALSYMGSQAQATRGGSPKVMILLKACATVGVLTTIYGAYKIFFEKNDLSPQSEAPGPDAMELRPSDVGTRPKPDGIVRTAVSYAPKYPVSNSDFSSHTLCAGPSGYGPLEDKIVRGSCTIISFKEGQASILNRALNVGGNVYLTNKHGIPEECPFELQVIGKQGSGISTNSKRILVTNNMVYRIPGKDLVFLNILCRPPGPVLSDYFHVPTLVGNFNCKFIGRDRFGEVCKNDVVNVKKHKEMWADERGAYTHDMWGGVTSVLTNKGDCGTALVANTPVGPVILGIHTLVNLARPEFIYSFPVSNVDVKDGLNYFNSNTFGAGVVNVSAPSAPRAVGELSPQSVVHKVDGTADVLGSFVGEFRPRNKTRVCDTIIRGSLEERGYMTDKTAPNMGRTPWELCLKDIANPVTMLNTEVLDEAFGSMITEMIPDDMDLSSVMVYDNFTAINGADGVMYCDKMNRRTSAGCPYKKSKLNFLVEDTDCGLPDKVDVTPEIRDEIDHIITTYQSKERYNPIFCGHLKDEPVSEKKAIQGATRVFLAAPMAFTIVVRKYFLSIVVLMMKNRFPFEMAPGIVAQSLEWAELYQYLTFFSLIKMIAGDYGKFDRVMPPPVILGAFRVLYDIAERAGYSQNDLLVLQGIALDIAYALVDFNGDLMMFFGSNPSGQALTVVINGLANSGYMRYAYMILRPVGFNRPFKSCVNMITYGDDMVANVDPSIPWFNHTAIQTVLSGVGITFTMADKESESKPYITIDECTFLKRSWRHDPDIGAVVGPLDHSSISKMLMVCVRSKNVSPQAHAVEVISTALREYFFYGKSEFEMRRVMFQEVIAKHDLQSYVEDSTLPTWEDLYDAFWVNSAHVLLPELED